MGYKLKPNKSVAKRFKVSKTGKLKRHHAYTSHLMSARPAKRRRKLRQPAVLFEGLARNMRDLMGVSRLKPAKAAAERARRAKKKAAAAAPAGDAAPAGEVH
jgi:large subunit ribosomal protein L35